MGCRRVIKSIHHSLVNGGMYAVSPVTKDNAVPSVRPVLQDPEGRAVFMS